MSLRRGVPSALLGGVWGLGPPQTPPNHERRHLRSPYHLIVVCSRIGAYSSEQLVLHSVPRFVGKPEEGGGVSIVFLTYFDYFLGGVITNMGEGREAPEGSNPPGPDKSNTAKLKLHQLVRGRWAPFGPLSPTIASCAPQPPVHPCSMQSTVDIAYTFIGGSTNLYFLNLYNYLYL